MSLVVIYGLALGGLLIGFRLARARPARLLIVPVLAIPIAAVAMVLWGVLRSLAAARFAALPELFSFLFGALFMLALSVLAGTLLMRGVAAVEHHRGSMLVAGPGARRRPGQLAFAGAALTLADETKHFKVLGATGTGKSTAIRALLAEALERGDRAIFADPDGGYLKRFYRHERGDHILNPFDRRSSRWDLFAEITLPHDADQLARSLIPDYEGSDRNWRHYARTFLTALLRQLHRAGDNDLTKLYYLLLLAPEAELSELIGSTPAGSFLGHTDGKFFDSVRAVANVHVAALEHLARQAAGESLSIRQWVRAGRGVLFMPYRAGEIAALRQVVSTWMRLAIFAAMDAEEGDQRLWFVVDELDALGVIDGLKDALARLRKFGGRCVLGFQSVAQVRGTYGDAEAQTIVENCGNTLILRCSASERGGTAEFASRLIGQREIIRRQISQTRGGAGVFPTHESKTTSYQHQMETAVLPSEIEQLPDLAGFLKIASRPEWHRVQLELPKA